MCAAALQPHLAYNKPSHTIEEQSQQEEFKYSMNTSAENQEKKCWNCGDQGNRFRFCKKPRRKFCFDYGSPDKVKSVNNVTLQKNL